MHQMTLNFIKINSFVKKIANRLNFYEKTNNFNEKCELITPEVKIRHGHVISGQFYRKKARKLIILRKNDNPLNLAKKLKVIQKYHCAGPSSRAQIKKAQKKNTVKTEISEIFVTESRDFAGAGKQK